MKSLVLLIAFALAFTSCKKNDDSDSSSDTPPAESDGDTTDSGGDGDGGDTAGTTGGDGADSMDDGPSGPGTLALGEVNFEVRAVNSLDVTNSRVASDDVDATPGNLAIMDGTALTNAGAKYTRADVGNDLPTPAIGQKGELNGITSGPPDGFKVKITRIVFMSTQQEQVVFEKAEGVELAIDGANVDLTGLLTAIGAAEGEPATFELPVGDYTGVEVTFLKKAEIKGCVEGLFQSGTMGKMYASDPDGAGPLAENDPIAEYTGTHEYCTQTAKSLYDVTTNDAADYPKNEDYENVGGSKTAEWMALELDKYPQWDFHPLEEGMDARPHSTDATETFNIQYELAKPVTLKKDESLSLTMVIDMNRLLRYDTGATANRYGPDNNRPSTDYPNTRNPSFFFDSVFRSSSFVFVGRPGGIYGYEILSLVCEDNLHDFTNKQCTDNDAGTTDDGYFAVETWMTLITDSDGAPLSLLISPKDDTRLTTLVGGHNREGPWIFPKSDTAVDIRYNMNEDFQGTIFNFPALLDDTAAVAKDDINHPNEGQFVLHWDLHDLDDEYDGKKVYPDSVTNGPGNGNLQGVAIFWRRL